MQEKSITLTNNGMNRDLSISKVDGSTAYDNHNIRIEALEDGTLLSVTNERGTKAIELADDIKGKVIGYNVLGNHIILFTTDHTYYNPSPNDSSSKDRIYRIDVDADYWFEEAAQENDTAIDADRFSFGTVTRLLEVESLGFSTMSPIESVVHYESEDVQKIYWVDGVNPMRFMNFMATGITAADIEIVKSFSDSISSTITKSHAGNPRPNGVAQYFLAYYNKHGQQSQIAWQSDLVYLSPDGKGGAPDGQNISVVSITLGGLSTDFDSFIVYSIFRSSLNAQPVAYIVADMSVPTGANETVTITDSGANLTSIDPASLLFVGSRRVVAETIETKDKTLFLGNINVKLTDDDETLGGLKKEIDRLRNGRKISITFLNTSSNTDAKSIVVENGSGYYPFTSQLGKSSSEILSFKGGEIYRFALKFWINGQETPAYWIGDALNDKYPVISDGEISRVYAKVEFTGGGNPTAFISQYHIERVQVLIAEATYANRRVKAQGFINPTMFNLWERYNDRLYSMPSWVLRPHGGSLASEHFHSVYNSTQSNGEIACNYWDDADNYKRALNDNNVGDFAKINSVLALIRFVYRFDTVFTGYEIEIRLDLLYLFGNDSGKTATIPPSYYDGDTVAEGSGYSISCKSILVGSTGYNSGADLKASVVEKLKNELSKDTYSLDSGTQTSISTAVQTLIEYMLADTTYDNGTYIFTNALNTGTPRYTENKYDALNSQPSGANRWYTLSGDGHDKSYNNAYYKKHFMFVDESVVTLHSPEITYEAINIDKSSYSFRIVGVAEQSSVTADYTIDATHGKYTGENVISVDFSKNRGDAIGVSAWPLWRDNGLAPTDTRADNVKVYDRSASHYTWSGSVVAYWMYLWGRSGKIHGYSSDSKGESNDGTLTVTIVNDDFGTLKSKTFTNLHFLKKTTYATTPANVSCDSIRQFNYTSSQLVGIRKGETEYSYGGIVKTSLMVPDNVKYPIVYSDNEEDTNGAAISKSAFLYSSDPVSIEFAATPHVVISFESGKLLPGATSTSGSVPWGNTGQSGDGASYSASAIAFNKPATTRPYVFLGEIYDDTITVGNAYGGTSDAALQNCRFIPAGPVLPAGVGGVITGEYYADRGDTYIQRWDCLMTAPYSEDSVNKVIDITSVILETHINTEGRTDNYRGTKKLASIDTELFGKLNRVYSQQDNFIVRHTLDSASVVDDYDYSISWTLNKADMSNIDEWAHINLVNTDTLDSRLGPVTALRTFNDRLYAFQHKGISEVLYNSRIQVGTSDGVPIELANSGRIDGVRNITSDYGCINKWSITRGKKALYFVDNINKAFCGFNGGAVENISDKLGFATWFRNINSLVTWKPASGIGDNIISFYDKENSDVYIVSKSGVAPENESTLVFNENLATFTSFFDYSDIVGMFNIEGKLISIRNPIDDEGYLWQHHAGLYCNLFGTQYDFWVRYKVTPNPQLDKIWTNVEYRADFFMALDGGGEKLDGDIYDVSEGYVYPAQAEDILDAQETTQLLEQPIEQEQSVDFSQLTYMADETFDTFDIWNEYQKAQEGKTPVKKFRIWRYIVPRAIKTASNKYGLDRIRNPWINFKMKKNLTDYDSSSERPNPNRFLMQLHDIVVKYFE